MVFSSPSGGDQFISKGKDASKQNKFKFSSPSGGDQFISMLMKNEFKMQISFRLLLAEISLYPCKL